MEGLWNGTPSDQFIESTWMKRGKGPTGIIGDIQNPQTVATWSYSQHAVVTLTGDLQMMTEEDRTPKLKHKEETSGRINSDARDRQSLRLTLSKCIDPLDPDSHPDGALINVVTGAIAPANVNIDRALTLGQEQLETFESSWPEGFHTTIKGQIVTFSAKRKAIKVGDVAVIDQEAIYARVIGLMVSQREMDFNEVLGCELAAYPTSMFHPDGSMRIATGKASLKNNLAVETSARVWGEPSVIVVDVSGVDSEEADITLVKHALWNCETDEARVCVISDDTDVFALLCYHYHKSGSSAPLMMQPSVHGRVCVDIPATVNKHSTLIPNVLAIHAISGCDTVAASYGIGKLTVVAASKKGFALDSLGVIDAPWDAVEKEATEFMVSAYGGAGATMSECRQRMWAKKTAKSSAAPKLCSLPPTTEAFMQNLKRAHFQVAQWYAALDADPHHSIRGTMAGKPMT